MIKYKTIMPISESCVGDWSNLPLDGADFVNKDLSYVKLPDDPKLFQKIKDKSLYRTKLPKGDYSKYNFDGVDLSCSMFSLTGSFSEDVEVFQKLHSKELGSIMLPYGDYRDYNFEGVEFDVVVFPEETVLSEEPEFLRRIKIKNVVIFPDNVIRNIHNYNLDGVKINLTRDRYKNILNNNQLEILKAKYPGSIGKTILLPEEALEKEDNKKSFIF